MLEVRLVAAGNFQSVNPCVAAIIASPMNGVDLPTLIRAHSRKQAASMGKALKEVSIHVNQVSISRASATSCLHVSSTPACNFPMVTAESEIRPESG